MDGLSGSSSSGNRPTESGGGSVNRSSVSSGKMSTLSNSQASKDSGASSLNREAKMKVVEEKDPYMMDLAEEIDAPAALYNSKRELSIGSKDKDQIREKIGIGTFKRSLSGPDSFNSSRDKDNASLSRKTNKAKKKRKHGHGSHQHHTNRFKTSKGHHIFGSASPCPDDMIEEDVITHVVGKKPLYGKVWKHTALTDVNNADSADGTEPTNKSKKGTCARYRCYNYGIEYKPGDTVYIQSSSADQPYFICCIQDIKYSKREALEVHIKWFYRTHEVPEQVYQLLILDRRSEHSNYNKDLKRKLMVAKPKEIVATSTNDQNTIVATANELGLEVPKRLDDIMLKQRELFSSDITDTFSVSVLRGKCMVLHCEDIQSVRQFIPGKDTFFYTLSYNPETRRLASHEGEIRVGASHQANLPELKTGKKDKGERPDKNSTADNEDRKDVTSCTQKGTSSKTNKGENCTKTGNGEEANDPKKDAHKSTIKKETGEAELEEDDEEDDFEEDERMLEEITWRPGRIHDHDLLMYLRAGRSMAAFAAMCDCGGSAEEGFTAASRDSITANAIQVLHECDYDTGKAVQNLLKTPFPPASAGDISRRWQEEDVKAFVKGLRVYGKNFFKIRVDFLPDKETSELVEFYYLWKKTPGASGCLPRGRSRGPQYNVNGIGSGSGSAALRRIKDGPVGRGGKFSKSSRKEDDPTDVSSASDGEEIEKEYEALQIERKAELEKLKRNGNPADNGNKVGGEGKGADGNENSGGTKKSTDDSMVNGVKDGLVSSAIDEMDMELGEELSPYYCRHCFTTSSKDWHHGGKEKLLLCTECRVYFKCYGELPCLEPPMTHASSIEDIELTDEDEEVDITNTDPAPPTSIQDDGGKEVKLDPEMDLMKSANLIKVPPPPMNEEEEALNLNAIEQDSKLPPAHHQPSTFSPSTTSANFLLPSSSSNLHHLGPSKDAKLSHPQGLHLGSGSLSAYRSGGIPGLPPPRAPLGPPGLVPPLHQLGFSKPGPPPLIDIVQKADQIAKQQREQQQLRQADLGFPPKAHNHGSAPAHQRLATQHHLSHHQPPSSGPPPAHASSSSLGGGSHGGVGSGSLISPISGPIGGSSGSNAMKPGLAHSNNFQVAHHSTGQTPLGIHSSSMGGGSILPPPPGLTPSSRTPSGIPPASSPSQRGPVPSHPGLALGPDPICRPRSTDIQVIGERFHSRGGISPGPREPPTQPRPPSPPPKPDSSECHRSQSAIFTRCWNRGEGNSCARTDLFFKPVPDSKLARKREERLRKATAEREEQNYRAAHAAAVAQNEAAQKAAAVQAASMAGRLGDPFSDPFSVAAAAAAAHHRMTGRITPNPTVGGPPGSGPRPSPFGPGHPLHSAAAQAELERLDRDRRSIEHAQHNEAMRLHSIAQSLQGSTGTTHPGGSGPPAHHPQSSRMSPFGPPPGHASAFPPAPSPGAPPSHTPPSGAFPPGGPPGLQQHLAEESRRLEQMAATRQAAERQAVLERQYAQLATDPLIRLRMAGVTPEIPGVPSQSQLMAVMQGANALSYLGLGSPDLAAAMRPPSIGLDPRFRSPADQMAAALMAAGPRGPPPGTPASQLGLPPGLAPPTSLASSVGGMDAMLYNRQMLEREHSLRAAADANLFAAAHHQQLQQQEEALLRLQGKSSRP